MLSEITALIPTTLPDSAKPEDFSRVRKLPLQKLIVFLLSVTASGRHRGIDGKSGEFFKQARRSDLWPEAEAVHRSAVTKARGKVPWEVLEAILDDAVRLAYQRWPDSPSSTWCGKTVIAFDGSKYTLPASQVLRETFDPESGLDSAGKGHYPQCLVSTAYDVFRRLPLARTVVPIQEANEREQAKTLLPRIPNDAILLFDRGYPSFDFIQTLDQEYNGFYLFRCPAKSTFPAVERFVQSGNAEEILWIDPSDSFLRRQSESVRDPDAAKSLRAIRLESPDGTVSVLLTNLYEPVAFPAEKIIRLYFRRWAIESHYRDEKVFLDIETFHSRTVNGIRQELFAVLIMSVIARLLMARDSGQSATTTSTPQFKNAVMALASDIALLAAERPQTAIVLFTELMREIARVRYYPPKTPRPSCPRVCKKPVSKWQRARLTKLAGA